MIKICKSAITLVEILIAISLGSLIIMPLILFFGISEKVTYKSINEVVAANLALQKIEELKSKPFSELRKIIESNAEDPIDGPFKEYVFPLELNGIWNTPGVEYAREAAISFFPYPNPDPSKPDYELQKRRIKIRVRVIFIEYATNQKKKEKYFELATIVSDENLGSGLNINLPTPLNTKN